jgi:2-polyprenyl-6-methoxyphenol hydroxylase-like FAD-dependent oxidoreductase
MTSVVVVGASVAGLAAALFLARNGHEVTLLESDGSAAAGSPEEAAQRCRPGVPQHQHAHTFHARCRDVLVRRAPDVLKTMLAVGAEEYQLVDWLPPQAAPAGQAVLDSARALVSLAARRTTFEWVLNEAVEHQPGVTWCRGVRVTGLVWSTGTSRVTGVRTDCAGALAADVVVDASGRRSRFAKWARDHCAARLPVRVVRCESVTYSRFYRVLGSEDVGRPSSSAVGNITAAVLDGFAGYAFRADAGVVALVLARHPRDTVLERLREDPVFDAVAGTVPALAPWVDPDVARPISPVASMAGLTNTLRDERPEGRPSVPGVVSVGDALCTTNPAFGRGASLALVHAEVLADGLAEDASPAAADRVSARLVELTEPWWADAVHQDRTRAAMWERTAGLRPTSGPMTPAPLSLRRAGFAARQDAGVWVRLQRVLNMLDDPESLFGDQATAAHLDDLGVEERPPVKGRKLALDAIQEVP